MQCANGAGAVSFCHAMRGGELSFVEAAPARSVQDSVVRETASFGSHFGAAGGGADTLAGAA